MSELTTLYLNGLIFSAIVLFAPMLVTFVFFLFKIKLNNISITYLYAFTTGLILILATFGFLKESYTLLEEHFSELSQTLVDANGQTIDHSGTMTLYMIIIIAGGVLFGIAIGILTKFIHYYKTKKQCSDHKNNIHGDCVYEGEQFFDKKESVSQHQKKNDKLVAILLMISHKFIDGLALGFLLYDAKESIFQLNNIGLVAGFILHMLPTTVALYYMYLADNNSKTKAFFKSTMSNLIVIPFIFLGILIGDSANSNDSVFWLLPLLLSIASGTLIFTSIMELTPEFVHKNHLCTKEWFFMMMWLTIGIVISLILSIIHNHTGGGHSHSHNSAFNVINNVV